MKCVDVELDSFFLTIPNRVSTQMSLRQEYAFILMKYADSIPEQTYMDILNEFGQVSAHRDPIGAADLQKQLDVSKQELEESETANELLIEQLEDAEEYINTSNRLILAIMKSAPLYEDDDNVVFEKHREPEEPNWTRRHRAAAHARSISMESNSIYSQWLRSVSGGGESDSSSEDTEEDVLVATVEPVVSVAHRGSRNPRRVVRRLVFTTDSDSEGELELSEEDHRALTEETREVVQKHYLGEVVEKFDCRIDNEAGKCLLHEWEGWYTPVVEKTKWEKRVSRFLRRAYQRYVSGLLSMASPPRREMALVVGERH